MEAVNNQDSYSDIEVEAEERKDWMGDVTAFAKKNKYTQALTGLAIAVPSVMAVYLRMNKRDRETLDAPSADAAL